MSRFVFAETLRKAVATKIEAEERELNLYILPLELRLSQLALLDKPGTDGHHALHGRLVVAPVS
ncbi:MAG TPA: hypothetical protein VIH42_05260 [Thermoguttaceae bacterium]